MILVIVKQYLVQIGQIDGQIGRIDGPSIYHETAQAHLLGVDGRASRRLAGRDALGPGPVERHPPFGLSENYYTPVSC